MLQAVAVHGSVAAAAGALHLSPPAVSQQLLTLERETGACLIDRSGRQVRLTAAGRLLAAHGERAAAQIRQAERDLAELTGQASGPGAARPSSRRRRSGRPRSPCAGCRRSADATSPRGTRQARPSPPRPPPRPFPSVLANLTRP
ncbi:MAG TPA: LysR family transcriptional regulator [Streptosporangiaceae bacterium]|nr:LysR family transcriptional regulator [Streptosporangiaceae bacterium]